MSVKRLTKLFNGAKRLGAMVDAEDLTVLVCLALVGVGVGFIYWQGALIIVGFLGLGYVLIGRLRRGGPR